ncbi:hypothetical protein HZB04_01935 [Candidatus Wolfebacteria bacterium]|nr:hypothetical protein [Candidatus Wolfebacteria bacterium]
MFKFFLRKSSIFSAVLFFSFFVLNVAFAADSQIKKASDVYRILGKIDSWMYTIFFFVAIFFVLLAAFKFLTVKDNPEQISGAAKSLMWAAVATIIALLSVGFGVLIQNFITITPQ